MLLVEDDAHFAALDFLVDQFWDLGEGEGGVPVVADGFGDFDQCESEVFEADTEFEVFPAVKGEAGVEESGGEEPVAGYGNVARGKEGGGVVGEFVGFALWMVEVGGVDDASVGEDAIGGATV